MFVCLFVCLCVCWFVCVFVGFVSFGGKVCLSVCVLYVCLHHRRNLRLLFFISASVSLFVCLLACLFVCIIVGWGR